MPVATLMMVSVPERFPAGAATLGVPVRSAAQLDGTPAELGVAAAALEHVGAVDPRAAHADEDLAGPGLGVRMLLDEELAVADRGGTHWPESKDVTAVGRVT